MEKKTKFFVLLFVFFAASASVGAFAATPLMERPAKPVITTGTNTMDETVIHVIFDVPPEITAFEVEAAGQTGAPNLVVEYDVRVDGGKWLMDREVGVEREAGLLTYYMTTLKNNFLAYDYSESIRKGARKIDCAFEPWMFGFGDEWDFKKHSYSFRYRYVYEQLLPNHGRKPGYFERVTEWSDETAIGNLKF
jgi:hypothetical protein